MSVRTLIAERQARCQVLRNAGILAGAGLAAGMGYRMVEDAAAASAGVDAPRAPIDHILVACQENRTFDTYFGYYPRVGSFGIPASYAQPAGHDS